MHICNKLSEKSKKVHKRTSAQILDLKRQWIKWIEEIKLKKNYTGYKNITVKTFLNFLLQMSKYLNIFNDIF